jgi:hypothetical protein
MRAGRAGKGTHRAVTRWGLVVVFALVGGKAAWNAVFQPTGPTPPGYAAVAPPGEWAELPWPALFRGKWEQGQKPTVSDDLKPLAGKPARVRGFLLPLHEAAEGAQFFMAKSPGGCYFCNPPGVNEVVMINVKGGQKLPQTNLPVTAFGTFQHATGKPDDQSLYVMDNAVLAVVH